MSELYDTISKKTLGKKIKVGVILKKEDNKILLLKNRIERIDKYFYDIPFVEVENFDEKNILNMLNCKYNIKIERIYGYVNEFNVLDENCSNILQVNLYSDMNIENKLMLENFEYKEVDEILDRYVISDYLRESLEIYKYNFNN